MLDAKRLLTAGSGSSCWRDYASAVTVQGWCVVVWNGGCCRARSRRGEPNSKADNRMPDCRTCLSDSPCCLLPSHTCWVLGYLQPHHTAYY